VRTGQRHASAAYELAAASGRPWQPGDQVAYYIAGRGAGVAVASHAKFLSAWDPAGPDENVDYYQAKVREVWERFRPFVEHEGLRPPADEAESPQLTLF
jgi:hypothetical protein